MSISVLHRCKCDFYRREIRVPYQNNSRSCNRCHPKIQNVFCSRSAPRRRCEILLAPQQGCQINHRWHCTKRVLNQTVLACHYVPPHEHGRRCMLLENHCLLEKVPSSFLSMAIKASSDIPSKSCFLSLAWGVSKRGLRVWLSTTAYSVLVSNAARPMRPTPSPCKKPLSGVLIRGPTVACVGTFINARIGTTPNEIPCFTIFFPSCGVLYVVIPWHNAEFNNACRIR